MGQRNKALDNYKKLIKNSIEEHGWAIKVVQSTPLTPVFCYTVGLCLHVPYELIITGLPLKIQHNLLNKAADQLIAQKVVLTEDSAFADIGNVPIWVKPISDDLSERLCLDHKLIHKSQHDEEENFSLEFSNEDGEIVPPKAFKLFQLLWPDTKGVYPGQDDMTPSMELVQDLDLILKNLLKQKVYQYSSQKENNHV